MDRTTIINTVGITYHTPNIEGGEYSYVQEAGTKEKLAELLKKPYSHYKLDIRFESGDVVLLVETKKKFTKKDEDQLSEYVNEERALHPGKKIIAMLANTGDDKIKVWKSYVEDDYCLTDETVLDKMEHYVKLFDANLQNDREKVLKNTYALNELLHKKDIDEKLRSQFVGTTLLYLKEMVKKKGSVRITDELSKELDDMWALMDAKQIRSAIESTLENLLDGSDNKRKKIELLQKNVFNDQKVKALSLADWREILKFILMKIYRYIDTNSAEGQDILNLFFITFNKYVGKADKNQAFTPDHITEFMCRLTEVDRTKRVIDFCCGSGSFLVQAMVKELADCKRGCTEEEMLKLQETVKKEHIYGIESEEKAYGLSTTNMLIHGDGNSNIKFGSCFDNEEFIMAADPDICLLNPPYNSKPISIPERYKKNWGKAKDGKEDPTKGLVFVHYFSDVIQKLNKKKEAQGLPTKTVKMAVLLPVSAAIGTSTIISDEKKYLLENNTLEAVFTLPDEIFYPGASACACCMLFTIGKPHNKGLEKETFFGYCKDDGFKKKKNLGRVEQFDSDNKSLWKKTEEEWLYLYSNKKEVAGKSSMAVVDGDKEWLCEAYMETDYSTLTQDDFQRTLNDYLSYLVKEGKVYES